MTLGLGEATKQHFIDDTYDAIYQDAFSPDANPELWSVEFFYTLFNALKLNGRLTTYSVKGDVRRALQSVGFKVEKHPGPPGGKTGNVSCGEEYEGKTYKGKSDFTYSLFPQA